MSHATIHTFPSINSNKKTAPFLSGTRGHPRSKKVGQSQLSSHLAVVHLAGDAREGSETLCQLTGLGIDTAGEPWEGEKEAAEL